MQKLKKDHIVLVFIILIIFSVFQYGIQKIYGFTLYPDEFGYWSSAANAVGYDWSEAASMGSYYSYGYSLILIPILKLFSGGVRAYRAAIAVNMLLMCAGVLLLWKISLKVFPQMEKRVCMRSGSTLSGLDFLYADYYVGSTFEFFVYPNHLFVFDFH